MIMMKTPLPEPPSVGVPVPHHHHAVSVQLPTWNDMVDLGSHHPRMAQIQRGGYPRSFLHEDVVKLANRCRQDSQESANTYLLFPIREYAQACVDFAMTHAGLSSTQYNQPGGHVVPFGFCTSSLSTQPRVYLYAASLPEPFRQQGLIFWRLTGLGISSRLAEACLKLHPRILSGPCKASLTPQRAHGCRNHESIVHEMVRTRLADLYNRTTSQSISSTLVSVDDIFLYPTGMAAIYHTHQLLLQVRDSKTVVFGFPYELTLKMVQSYGPAWEFYGFGTDEELDQFEASLEFGNPDSQIQAVWCECASNPLLRTVDLERIYRLAEKYNFIVIIDDTIGSVANVDVLDVADIVVTSLTKSFSGYANVMAGSIILNPRSRHHSLLKAAITETYESLLFHGDAEQLELNSRDYLQRSTQANKTASALAQMMETWSTRVDSPFTSIYYPELCWSKENYVRRMRPSTADYTSGFGSLFTIELADVDIAAIFFNALPVHKGPSLGAQYTLAQPYVQTVFQKEKDWAASYGLKESIVRISVGLEDCESLVSAFEEAAQVAYDAYRGRALKSQIRVQSYLQPSL